MDILYLLVPLSLVLVFIIGGVFWWTLRSGMFDDLEGPAWRVLQDDDNPAHEGPPDRPGGDRNESGIGTDPKAPHADRHASVLHISRHRIDKNQASEPD
ncbi:MAG TPA: cbb3-type cytochrome oxidase assembly protein CcoS [Casimicrobiaceae bacterium]|nr:cbb3-type cytochrome oxidase assembly protein CcoS [Casimicrobiaceae bacterium]